MPEALRVVFAGTPDFAADALLALINADTCNVLAVYSQPDRPKGRGKKLSPSPVKALALQHDLPVFQPINFKHIEDLEQLAKLEADVMVVAAYGLLLPASALSLPRLGCINIHASLLPKWRGAAPIERAIQHGDEQTGVTIMQMDEGLDTGNMLLKRELTISAGDTGDSVRTNLATLGSKAVVEVLERASCEAMSGEPQDSSLASYASKIHKQECLIDWSDSANQIALKIRAFYSGYTCHSFLNGERIKLGNASATNEEHCQPPGSIIGLSTQAVLVSAGEGVVSLSELQCPGGRMLKARDLLNSRANKFQVGFQFIDQQALSHSAK